MWEEDPYADEQVWSVTARVDLANKVPATVSVCVEAEDGIDAERLQREFRWQTPADIVRVWLPSVLATGASLDELEPPHDWWFLEGKQRLSDEFLEEIAAEYKRQGRGYAKPMAIKYHTTERTVRSWIDKARERGILGAALGPGKFGEQIPRQQP
jgi:hypothetical protein